MGIEWHTARFLVSCHKAGTQFKKVATIGRQNLYTSPAEIEECFEDYGCQSADGFIGLRANPIYSEPLFTALGSENVVSVDASDYEGATLVHDMNQPIAESQKAQFDVVFDGGSLEHVFNFPTAIRNCMEMVKLGGHLIMQTPMNGFAGHGFYQFSPELLYRIFSEKNGFQVERMIAFEYYYRSQWYDIADPEKVRSRIELVRSEHQVGMIMRARRTRIGEIFEHTPQQSDYAATWHNKDEELKSEQSPSEQTPSYLTTQSKSGAKHAIKHFMESAMPGLVRKMRARKDANRNRRFSFEGQPQFFIPVDK
jgi:SAM-dependent methyltransferase